MNSASNNNKKCSIEDRLNKLNVSGSRLRYSQGTPRDAELFNDMSSFGIDEYGEMTTTRSVHISSDILLPNSDNSDIRKSNHNKKGGRSKSLYKTCSLDFIQEIARAGSKELNVILKICIDLFIIEVHVNRIPNGSVENELERIRKNFYTLCERCEELNLFVRKLHKEQIQKNKNEEKTSTKKKRLALSKIYGGLNINNKEGSKKEGDTNTIGGDNNNEDILKYGEYGSELLQTINLAPDMLIHDVKNIRRCIIWTIMCHSKAVQRLIRCGKFFSFKYKCGITYAPIPKDSINEFIHWIVPLKNNFCTAQMGAENFVVCVRLCVERKGVHDFVQNVLTKARKMETRRITKNHLQKMCTT